MTARGLMTQRALVERFTSPGDDDFGNPLPADWTTHIASMPCLLYGSAEREAVSDAKTVVVADLKLIAPKGTDITERDRLNGITDRRGNVIRAGLLGIAGVLLKRDHLELSVGQVSS